MIVHTLVVVQWFAVHSAVGTAIKSIMIGAEFLCHDRACLATTPDQRYYAGTHWLIGSDVSNIFVVVVSPFCT